MAGNLFGMIEIQKAANKYTFEQFLSILSTTDDIVFKL